MKWYPWLGDSYQQIIASHQAGHAHPALLLHSLPGMGEQSLIYAITRWLMCQQPDGQKSCGRCRTCQLMQAGTHPDFYKLQAEAGKSTLGIDAIRQLTENLAEHARMGGAKLIWLPYSEQLSEAAANALLKTLEEPPARTWFHLVCQQPKRLPVTLRSRCIRWYLAPPATDTALNWLQHEQQQPADALQLQAALRLSGGAPLAALALLQTENSNARQQLCQRLAEALSGADYYSLLTNLDHDQVLTRLHWLAALLLDGLKYQQGAQRWLTNLDQQPLIAQLAASQSTALLHWQIHAVCRCREQLAQVAGVNRQLLLAELLLNWEHHQSAGTIPQPLAD